MTIASAANAAVPTLPGVVASRTSTDDDSASGAQFARHLNGLTTESEDADAWRPAGSAKSPQNPPEQGETTSANPPADLTAILGKGFGLTRLPARGLSLALGLSAAPKSTLLSQTPTHKTPRTHEATGESPQAIPIAVPAVPAPEIDAAVSATADELVNNIAKGVDADIPVQPAVPHRAPDALAGAARPTVTAATGPAQPAQEMAFAARVQPVQSTEQSPLSAEMSSAAAVASASKKVVGSADEANANLSDARGLLAATNTTTAELTPATSPTAQSAGATHRVEVPASPADNSPRASAPLKDISLQVNQVGKERVDVRVVQQGSEVRVSVHSGDSNLTSGLRQGLSELQSRLEESGYRSETWRPGASTAPLAPAPSAQASTNHSRGGDGNQQQGGSQQQESGRRNPNQTNQPRWVEELDSSLTGGEKSSGGFYGFSS